MLARYSGCFRAFYYVLKSTYIELCDVLTKEDVTAIKVGIDKSGKKQSKLDRKQTRTENNSRLESLWRNNSIYNWGFSGGFSGIHLN